MRTCLLAETITLQDPFLSKQNSLSTDQSSRPVAFRSANRPYDAPIRTKTSSRRRSGLPFLPVALSIRVCYLRHTRTESPLEAPESRATQRAAEKERNHEHGFARGLEWAARRSSRGEPGRCGEELTVRVWMPILRIRLRARTTSRRSSGPIFEVFGMHGASRCRRFRRRRA
jgi:hypothetical protein